MAQGRAYTEKWFPWSRRKAVCGLDFRVSLPIRLRVSCSEPERPIAGCPSRSSRRGVGPLEDEEKGKFALKVALLSPGAPVTQHFGNAVTSARLAGSSISLTLLAGGSSGV